MSPGRVLAARYELRTPIGRGGMGEVWVGYDRVLSRQVAVKVLDLGGTPGPETVERFHREATASAAISHPHVVTIHDAGVEGPHAYLVMELLSGPTIGELVQARGSLDAPTAMDLARQAARGLDAVHRVGVVHRDVKPSNLMLDDHGRVKVVDFGIARLAEATSSQLTATGSVVGSAPFLSPEQALGKPATPASDYYALGCVLTAMLTGHPPFTAEHPMALLRQHVSDPPPRIRERRPDLPPWVDEIVAQLLAKDPAVRRAGFVALLGGAASTGAPASTAILPPSVARGGTSGDLTAVLPMAGAAVHPPRRRGLRLLVPAALALAGVALAAVIAGIVLTEAHRHGDASANTKAPDPSPTVPTRTPTPTPTPTPSPTPVLSFDDAVDNLHDTIKDARQDGEIDDDAAHDLDSRVDDLRSWGHDRHGHGNKHDSSGDDGDRSSSNDLVSMLNDFDNELGDLLAQGDLDPAGAARIHQAIDAVRVAAA